MMILQEPLHAGHRRAARGWPRLGRGNQAPRYTEAWEHETFAEEQARWERSDPEYARICEDVRQARDRDDKASQCADEAKAEWDARVATQRQADDAAQRWNHRSLDRTRTQRLAVRARQAHPARRAAGREVK